MSEVVIRTAAGIVTSIITTGSVKRMKLKEGDNVFAVTKATALSVEKEWPSVYRQLSCYQARVVG